MFYAARMHRLFLCVVFWAAAAAPAAEIYRWVDPDGNTQYSDKPRPDAQVIHIPDAPPAPPPKPSASPAPVSPDSPPAAGAAPFSGYENIAIVSPPNDGTVWDNSGNVSVEVAVAPALQGKLGHKLVVLLNGTPVGESTAATSFTMANLDRDTYTLQARIVDGDGQVVGESPPSVFHMKRITVAPTAPPAAGAGGSPAPRPATP